MKYLLLSILIIVLGIILYQDLKYRAVWWWVFLVGSGVFIWQGILQTNFGEYSSFVLINWSFVLLQLSMVGLYVLIKQKSVKGIFCSFIGIGDLLFLIMVSFAMSPGNYIIFTVISFVFALFVFMGFKKRLTKQYIHVPLAGLQALFLVFCMFCAKFLEYNLLDDFRIYQWMIH